MRTLSTRVTLYEGSSAEAAGMIHLWSHGTVQFEGEKRDSAIQAKSESKGGIPGSWNGRNDFSTVSNTARHQDKSDCLHAYLEFHDMFVVLKTRGF